MFDILVKIKYYRKQYKISLWTHKIINPSKKQQLHNQVLRVQKGFQENSLHEVIDEDKWHKCSPWF